MAVSKTRELLFLLEFLFFDAKHWSWSVIHCHQRRYLKTTKKIMKKSDLIGSKIKILIKKHVRLY